MAKTGAQLSTGDQILLTLACLVFFSMAVAVSGFMAGAETRAKLAAFASEGAVVAGAVTDKRINVVGKARTWVHWLDVTFTSADGIARSLSANVANSIYDRYAVGSPVKVAYVRSKPEWFYVPGGEPTQRDARIFDRMLQYGAGAAVLCAMALLGGLFHRRAAGATDRQAFNPPRPSRMSSLSAPGSRAQFGTRRA